MLLFLLNCLNSDAVWSFYKTIFFLSYIMRLFSCSIGYKEQKATLDTHSRASGTPNGTVDSFRKCDPWRWPCAAPTCNRIYVLVQEHLVNYVWINIIKLLFLNYRQKTRLQVIPQCKRMLKYNISGWDINYWYLTALRMLLT
jgi:hypothetical protein